MRRFGGLPAAPLLLAAFFALMGAAWLMATPPGSSFDEPAHYVKAVGVGRGELAGTAPGPVRDPRSAFFQAAKRDLKSLKALVRGAETPAARWQARTQRLFEVPAGRLRASWGCTIFHPETPGSCAKSGRAEPPPPGRRVATYTGTYQPFAYLPAGLATRVAHGPELGMRLARAATLAVALALLITATALLWSPRVGVLGLLGLVTAVTPMVLFVGSVLSPSAAEITGALCFAAALLRLVRDEPPPSWLWVALAAGGAVLASARTLGPAFVVVLVLSVGLLAGPRTLMARLRAGGRAAAVAGSVVAAAAAACLAWQVAYQPRPSPSETSVVDAIGPSWEHLGRVGQEAIGIFGALDAEMPAWGYWLWAALVVALVAAALLAGDRRDRISIAALAGAAVVVTMVMSLVYREIGPLHGRYALPFLVFVPLWPAEVLVRRRDRLAPGVLRALVPAILAGAAVVHLLGWWTDARRFAVGDRGSWLFFDGPAWSPPPGWWPWLLLAVAGCALYVVVAASALRTAPAPAPPGEPPARPQSVGV
jgi:hypothetical protein